MKIRLQSLLIILTAILFFTACEKKEELNSVDSILGILSAGENVSPVDLDGLNIFLGRFHDSLDFSSITFNTIAIDLVATTKLNADGAFSFSGLTAGYYGLALEDGFIITGDTALSIHFTGQEQEYITKNIERIAQDNGQMHDPFTKIPKITFKRDNSSSTYKLKMLKCYNDSQLDKSYDVPGFTNNWIKEWELSTIYEAGYIKFELVFSTLDNAGNEISTFASEKIPYYSRTDKTSTQTWSKNSINIQWVPYYKESGWWPFGKEEIFGHYTISYD